MAKVSFVRGTDAQIEQLELTEGQVVVSESGKMYVDTDTDRIPISPKEETITAVYDTTTATSAHAVDSYVYVNNHLYRVTVAIAIGDTITVGTNVVLANDLDTNTPVYVSGLPDSSGGLQAIDVGYDNTESGLNSENVQDAIDELANAPAPITNIEAVYEETTALSAHSVDDYICMNNLLYRVTSAISIGDSIVVDTNVELVDDGVEGTEIYISNIPSSSGGGVEADDVGYDNTDSGLTANDVQDAIDELDSDLKNVKDNFEGCTTEFNNDGSITETYSDRIKTTEFNNDGSITETITKNGVVIAIKTTTFNQDGSITEEVE